MFILTKHAIKRSHQRGIKDHYINIFLDYADLTVNVGNGDQSISISRKTISLMSKEGVKKDIIEKLSKIAAVVTCENIIKTFLIIDKKRRHHYQKGKLNSRKAALKTKPSYPCHLILG